MRIHEVAGGGGLKLHVRDCGPEDAPAILFIHGWMQHHLAWKRQLESALAERYRLVALDLRGHGASQAPLERKAYTDGALWAEDVRAILEVLALRRPVLCGWSYGGYVISDYVRRHGDAALGGIVFAGASLRTGAQWAASIAGPALIGHRPGCLSPDQPTCLAATRAFVHDCFSRPIPAADLEIMVGYNMLVRPDVRRSLQSRSEDFVPDIAKVTKPILVAHGTQDLVILPGMAELIKEAAPHATLSWYEGVGHAPFLEEPERFNSELAAFLGRLPG